MTQDELLALIDQAAEEGWTELDLSGQGLTELSPEIGKLTQLETLILGQWEKKKRGPQGVEGFERINNEWLPLVSGNALTSLPAALGNLRHLKQLDISGNPLVTVPACIGKLTQLENLTAIRASLIEIPETLGQCPSLQSLDLRFNQITTIPEALAQSPSLQLLNLGNNQITIIPEVLAQSPSLQLLHLFNNQITTIPEALAQSPSLQLLNLSDNQITTIPDALAQCSSLQSLYLRNNQITTIPDALAQCSSLRSLDLSDNQITTIPDALAQCSSLQSLYLSDNQITTIPDALVQCSSLRSLNLRDNQITTIPEALGTLPQLQHLDLRRNPLPISPEILGPPELHEPPGKVSAIFNYLRQLHSGKVKPLNEAKLLLVGQGSVGKTSLVQRLLRDRFNSREPQTDGLNVESWNIHVNAKDVRLNVWDFGGQEIYHATHQFFLTKRSLYLLVCNCRTSEEENRIEYWLKLIQSFGGASPVIIVGNKKDEQPLDINRKALREKYPNIQAILETSCETGEGIDALKAAITQEVGKLHDVYNLLPLSWFEVKEQLEAMQRDFITYNEYIGICYRNDIPEEHNQEQLIGLLHNLGLVLNFREHPILQSTNVLNPDWVTQGIYALLSDETLKTQSKGILMDDDLSRVLSPERYPADRHRYLTELMQEFQLCFALPNCPNPKFLIPGLLPKDEPDDTSLRGDTLEFQYHYRILPESIVSRFIVLSHEKIHNQTCWRSGVMLAYREGDEVFNIARIRADTEDKDIFIAVSGRENTRRGFLSLIRDTFTKIHNSFANLEVTEWVPVPGHPNHPPLDYQELLGLEAMGELEYPIGKLRIKVNLRQLLDGYEPLEARQRQQLKERGLDIEYRDGAPGVHIHVQQENRATHQYGEGNNIAGDKVMGDKIGTQTTTHTN
ncbi:MAG: GTP-binding protein [Leptolyngbya sp. SIO1D8]|nr:GTP-binding protein [Leptolyngbya sp. SIO1D8]